MRTCVYLAVREAKGARRNQGHTEVRRDGPLTRLILQAIVWCLSLHLHFLSWKMPGNTYHTPGIKEIMYREHLAPGVACDGTQHTTLLSVLSQGKELGFRGFDWVRVMFIREQLWIIRTSIRRTMWHCHFHRSAPGEYWQFHMVWPNMDINSLHNYAANLHDMDKLLFWIVLIFDGTASRWMDCFIPVLPSRDTQWKQTFSLPSCGFW